MTITATTWCVFRLGGSSYALDIGLVGEVLPAAAPTPLPRSPAGIAGLVNLRGRPLAVVDPWQLFDLQRPAGQQPTQVLVLRTAVDLAALPVDACAGVITATSALLPADRDAHPPWVAGFLPLADGALAAVIAGPELLRRLDRLRPGST